MKRLALLLVLLLPALTFGATFGFGQEYSLRQTEEAPEDLYALGGIVTIAKQVLGDLNIVGGKVFVGESVSEDALIVGGTVDVIASVEGDLRVVSGRALLRGLVGEDAAIASGNLHVLPGSLISGNLFLSSGTSVIDGTIAGNLEGFAGNLTINGLVEGNVSVTADRIVIGPNARIDGNFEYSASTQAEIHEGATIAGEVTYSNVDTRTKIERLIPTLSGTWVIVKFFVLLISALVIQGIFRAVSLSFIRRAVEKPWRSLLLGFLFLTILPIVLFLMLLTFIGIPFAVLGMSAYTNVLVLAYLFNPIVIGSILFKLFHRDTEHIVSWKSVVVGVLAIIILDALALVGFTIQTILLLITLGAICQTLFERFARAR